METSPKHPEVALIFTRLLSELRLSGSQLAKSLQTSQQVINGYTSGRTSPGREMFAAIIRRYPAINAAWLATGAGEPFPTGRFNEKPAPPPDEPTPPAAPAAAAVIAPLAGDVLDKLLNQINSAAQQHREELAALKKEHKANLNGTIRLMQASANIMAEKIHYMEGRLGLRPLTAAEVTAQQVAEAPRAKKIGLKHYDESAPTARLLSMFAGRPMETSTLLAA